VRCLDRSEIARAATTGDVPAHVDECLDCRRELDQQLEMRRALGTLATPALSDAHRRSLKAETLAAIGQRTPARKSRYRWMWAPAALAAAAAVFVLLRPRLPQPTATDAPQVSLGEQIALADRIAAREDAPPPRRAPTIGAGKGAVLTHTPGAERDAIALTDGSVDIDTRGSRDVDVHVGRTLVRVVDSRVRIRARNNDIVSVNVVIGAARIVGPDQVTIERHNWTAPPPPVSAELTAFRDGWIALRAGRDRDAIALFDRAKDPAVAEEATYWAAVAAGRAGDVDDANRRFTDFLARFPASPYADRARAALRPH
jgi:hypothetical protein